MFFNQIVIIVCQKFLYFKMLFEVWIWLAIGLWIIKSIIHINDNMGHVVHF
jgi:hypothetical protein